MDPVTLTATVTTFLAPYLAKAGKSLMEKASDELPGAVGKLWDSLKGKMESRPESASLPDDLAKAPEDEDTKGAFKFQLKKILNEDPEFSEMLAKMLEEAKNDSSTTIGGNNVVATNGSVVNNLNNAGGTISGSTINISNTKP